MSQFLVRSRACWISLAFALAGCLFVNVIQIDGQQSGRPAAVPHPLYFPAGGLSMSVCAKQLQFLTDWNATKGAASSMTSVSNAGSAQQVLLSRLQDPYLCRRSFARFGCAYILHTFPTIGNHFMHTHTLEPRYPFTHSLIHSFSLASVPLHCHVDKFNMLRDTHFCTHITSIPTIHPQSTHWLSDFASLSLFAFRVCVCIIFATSRLLFTVQRAALLYIPHWPLFLFCFTAPI